MPQERKPNWRELTEHRRPISKHRPFTRNPQAQIAKRRKQRKRKRVARHKQRRK